MPVSKFFFSIVFLNSILLLYASSNSENNMEPISRCNNSIISLNSSINCTTCPISCDQVVLSIEPIGINFEHIEVYLYVSIFVVVAILVKLIWHLPYLDRVTSHFPESVMLIILGIIFGFILFGISKVQHHSSSNTILTSFTFTPTLFFLVLLPPIVLEAGYFMDNRHLFENALTISLLALVNTIWNAFGIGFLLYGISKIQINGISLISTQLTISSALLFGTVISAVDPVAVLVVFEEIHVNKLLHILVFGESLFNDAVTVVLFGVLKSFADVPFLSGNSDHNDEVENYISMASGCKIEDVPFEAKNVFYGILKFFIVNIGGVLIGIIVGYFTCFITRFTDHIRVLEPMFIFIMAYLAYLLAELFELSGIISMIAVAITMKHYVEANISHKSHTVVKYGIKMLSLVSETVISLFLGIYLANFQILLPDWGLIIFTLLFISIFRAFGIFSISFIVNLYRVKKISFKDQFIMSYSGLRGAVAFGLALISFSGIENLEIEEIADNCAKNEINARKAFVTTTLIVVLFTVFFQGSTVKFLMKFLHVRFADEKNDTLGDTIHETAIDHISSGLEEISGSLGHHRVRDLWERLDAKYLRRLFERFPEGRDERILHKFVSNEHKLVQNICYEISTLHGHSKDVSNPKPSTSKLDLKSFSHLELYKNITHLMNLSKAKREPQRRRRHKHLLFDKYDIHIHPHFFHRHKKTVSKHTHSKITKSEIDENYQMEPMSSFHPSSEIELNCLNKYKISNKRERFIDQSIQKSEDSISNRSIEMHQASNTQPIDIAEITETKILDSTQASISVDILSSQESKT